MIRAKVAQSPELSQLVEDGYVEIAADLKMTETGVSYLSVQAKSDYESLSIPSEAFEVEVYSDNQMIDKVEMSLEVLPVLVFPFQTNERTGVIEWQTPEEELNIPVHQDPLTVCFQMQNDALEDHLRVHVEGASKQLPHNPRNLPLVDAGDVYRYVWRPQSLFEVRYREHYTEDYNALRTLRFNVPR